MSADLLKRALQNNVDLGQLFQWLSSDEGDKVGASLFNCLQGEFVSYFLNFVHNEIAHLNQASQLVHTPKNIKDSSQLENKRESVRKRLNCSNTDNKPKESSTPKQLELTPRLNASFRNAEQSPNNSVLMSPISPLYNSNYSFTRHRKADTGNPRSERSMSLGDFLVHKSSEKKSKRINPTNVNQRKCSINLNKSENSYSFKQEDGENSLLDHRSLMLEERSKLTIKSSERSVKIKTQLFEQREVSPETTEVTFKEELDVAVAIYSHILQGNMLVNISSEIHYLVSLLLKSNFTNHDVSLLNGSEDSFRTQFIFQSVHNIIYFISHVLWGVRTILLGLDDAILRNLCENKRFSAFVDVSDVNFDRLQSESAIASQRSSENGCTNVIFDTETDNRENFPSDASFHAFKKQRDLFYDVLRIWEQNHFDPNWSFSLALSGKIKTLLSLHGDSQNFRHLAKLFKAQLLSSGLDNDIIPDELSFLAKYSNVNSDKLNRLKTRLFTKQDSATSANPGFQFPGSQEFFREFILNAANYPFVAHLRDAFIYEISELSKNYSSKIDQEFEMDVAIKESYKSTVRNLKTLAKFLGFLDSLPYKSYVNPREKHLESAVRVRHVTQPSVDLHEILQESTSNGCLIVTIPWLVAYLGMLDYVTLRLPYFSDLNRSLFKIYSSFNWTNDEVAVKNKALVTVSIGWLLELPQFPSELYFDWLSIGQRIETLPRKNPKKPKLCLDNSVIVDQRILYDCCPYLEEIKKLLVTNVSNRGATVKHITPLSAATDSSSSFEENKLKLKLEEAFLNAQPTSTRKTIEFISERVASAAIKHICNKIVPDYKKVAVEELNICLKNADKDHPDFAISAVTADLAVKCLEELLRKCREEVRKIRSDKIGTAMHSLLAIDEFENTKRLCISIADKTCNDRIEQWILTHVNKDIFSKTFDSHLPKNEQQNAGSEKLVFMLPSVGKNVPHNPECLSAVNCVTLIRSAIWDLLKKTKTNWPAVETIVTTVDASFRQRCDFNDIISAVIHKLLLELLLLYFTHNYTAVLPISGEVIATFASFWKSNCCNQRPLFAGLLCPRNVLLLAQSTDPKTSWSLYAALIKTLLKESLLTHTQFETQCVAMYQQNWDQGTLANLSRCIQEVVASDRSRSRQEFNPLLLSFLGDYCCDLNDVEGA